MGLLDKPFRSLSKTLINVLGGSATFQRKTESYDPLKGETYNKVTQTWAIKYVADEEFEKDRARISGKISGKGTTLGEADATTLVVVIDATTIESGPGTINTDTDSIVIGGVEYAIEAVQPQRAADQAVTYSVQLRA